MIKGIILAGGRGTRLWPITKVVSKHLLPVDNQPVIFYPIMTLKNAGIKEILIVCGSEHTQQYVEVLGSGKKFGVNFSYFAKNPKNAKNCLNLPFPVQNPHGL